MNRKKWDNVGKTFLCILISSITNGCSEKLLEPNTMWLCTFKHVQYIKSHNIATKCTPETKVTMNHYGLSLHKWAENPYTVSGLLNKTQKLHFMSNHNVFIFNSCFSLRGLLNTDINTFFKPGSSTVVEFNSHWKHLTLIRDMLTPFCTRDALDASGAFLQQSATTLQPGSVFPWSRIIPLFMFSHHFIRLQVVFFIQNI